MKILVIQIMGCMVMLFCQLPLNAQYLDQLQSPKEFKLVKPHQSSISKNTSNFHTDIHNRYNAPASSSEEMAIKLDYPQVTKETNSYTQKLDSFITYVWNNDECANQTKLEFTYDKQGNTTSRLILVWDAANSKWLNYSKEELLYDESGRIIQSAGLYWDTEQWIYSNKVNMTFSDTLDIIIESVYDFNTEEWINCTRCDKIFAADSMLEVFTNWDPVIPEWTIDRLNKYYYNEFGQEVFIHYIDWNEHTEEWINDSARTFEYDENSHQIQGYNYSWETDWVMTSHFIREFDEQDNITKYYNFINDEDMGEVFDYATESTYDALGNQVDCHITWAISKDVYYHELFKQYFDVTCNANEIAYPPYFNMFFASYKTKLTNSDYYVMDVTGTDWILSESYVYYYSALNEPTQIKNNITANLNIYPNPSKDHLYVDLQVTDGLYTVELFDMTGRKVLSTTLKGQAELNTDVFHRGLYLLVVSDHGKTIKSEKVVLE